MPPSPATPALPSLAELPPGAPAVVAALQPGHGGASIVERLAELGFLPGEPVEIVGKGPGGREPLAVRIGESMFALRLIEARCVLVRGHAA